MREILFRGKSEKTGEWIYGNLNIVADVCCEISSSFELVNGTWHLKEHEKEYVEPETVGEYSGLLDKNGNKLYEGDIVRAKFVHNGTVHTFFVEFDTGSFLFNNGFISVSFREIAHIKLVGNIHDNPELIPSCQ